MNQREVGTRQESRAAEYLESLGYHILERNFRCRFGEIDLVAWDGDTLCFVEVKTRTNTQMGLPREYVTARKQVRLRKTALFYLSSHELDCPARFDVAEVYAPDGLQTAKPEIRYYEHAFW